ncbi:MAG TPA: nucleoside recognition protein [Bacteroidetes bacterium]|nr:spore maturation protein A [bacterium BMS3Bbin04]HDO66240.1 nucleoside recognition protein [Bacteroidota bacterium]HEX05365.1 nucleoside recognition protein [Bacteroidota bacterium]
MNIVWMGLIVVAIVVAAFTGHMEETTNAAMSSAKTAVELAIGLIGVMALWLGLMKIAEKAGLIQSLARMLRPLLKRIFPEVPDDHPAMGSMLANIAANMLGLGNSATALGLRAMQDLQKLNVEKDSASNSMATFLAINTSSVTIIPATVIAIRASAGSNSPAEIIGPVIVATLVSTTVAILAVRLLQRAVPAQVPDSEPSLSDDQLGHAPNIHVGDDPENRTPSDDPHGHAPDIHVGDDPTSDIPASDKPRLRASTGLSGNTSDIPASDKPRLRASTGKLSDSPNSSHNEEVR